MSAAAADDVVGSDALAAALGALGIPCVVEQRAGLAVIVVSGGTASLASASVRRDVLALGRRHGFTHVAVELAVDPAARGATVLRD